MANQTKLIVRTTAETKRDGIAGCEVRYLSGFELMDTNPTLNVMIVDADGRLAGPYILKQNQIKAVQRLPWYEKLMTPLVWFLLMFGLIAVTAGLMMAR